MPGLCNRMEREGITNPDTQEGIDLCLGCELETCEMDVGDKRNRPGGKIYIRKQQVRLLQSSGLTVKQIAKEMGINERMVYRCLR